jgi:quinol monooxygenase YgiN
MISRRKDNDMAKIEIDPDNGVFTLINLFDVEPKNQQELITTLKGGAETLLSKQPGYLSVAIHRSQDGKHAVVYSQWRRAEDFQAVRTNADVQQYFARVRDIATFEPIGYDVTYVDRI